VGLSKTPKPHVASENWNGGASHHFNGLQSVCAPWGDFIQTLKVYPHSIAIQKRLIVGGHLH
jgi:hypothetical protein